MHTATDTTASQAFVPSGKVGRAGAERHDARRQASAHARRRSPTQPSSRLKLVGVLGGVREDVSDVLLPWLAVSVTSAVFLFAVALARTVWRGVHAAPQQVLTSARDAEQVAPVRMTLGPQPTPACRDG